MITTVTLNTMLDKTVYVDKMEKGRIQRARHVEMVAGGKGINVSRQLRLLGCDTIATGFCGGAIGRMIEVLMTDENIRHDFVEIDSMTREGVTYREDDGTVTSVFEPPHDISKSDAEKLMTKCVDLAGQSSWISFNGSSPHRNADALYREVMVAIDRYNIRTVLDTYGEPLRLAIDRKPYLFKPNKQEYEKTFDTNLDSEKMYRNALEDCLKRGIFCTILTNGQNPVYVGTPDGHWMIKPPEIKTVNMTGSGDALIAGFIYAHEKKQSFEECMATAVAAGAANAQKWSVANSTLIEINDLMNRVTIRKL
jgi:1-phosphofructokinase family hexose kinase